MLNKSYFFKKAKTFFSFIFSQNKIHIGAISFCSNFFYQS